MARMEYAKRAKLNNQKDKTAVGWSLSVSFLFFNGISDVARICSPERDLNLHKKWGFSTQFQ